MSEKKSIDLNPSQSEAISSESKEIVYLSGIGGGKTFLLACFIWKHISVKGSLGLISAPTYDVMKNSTFKGIEKAFDLMGVKEGIHYVVNIRPPESWNVKPFSKLNNSRVITWRNGSYTVLETLDNFNKIRGAEYDFIAVDEFRDTKFSEVRKVLIGRLRGEKYKSLNLIHQLLWVSTPPDDVRELLKVLEDKSVHYIQGNSYENKSNLPEGYIESLISSYDPITAQREVYGIPVNSQNEKQFAYAYDQPYHYVSFSEIKEQINYKEPLRIAFDFNVNPITAIVGQSTHEKIRIFKSFSDKNSDTEELCRKIKAWLGDKKVIIQVTGDASGFKRDTRSKLNDYKIIQMAFGLSKYAIMAPHYNPSVRDSRVLINSILSNMDVAFDADRENCRDLDQDLLLVTANDDGTIDKKKHGAHIIDCWRYFCQTWHGNFLAKSYK